jgi:FixJ family two-component response regulator
MTGEKHSILIIDDEPAICDLLLAELSEWGYECATSHRGDDALTSMVRQRFEVALVDIKLPGLSGMELLKKMRMEGVPTAAIMITAMDDVDLAVQSMRLGASGYLVKPLDMTKLLHDIRLAMDDHEEENERIPETAARIEPEEATLTEELPELNAIAFGVEVRDDFHSGFSEVVTRKTVEIARDLQISEEAIRKWEACRMLLDSEKKKRIESSFAKLKRSPLRALLRNTRLPWEMKPGGNLN